MSPRQALAAALPGARILGDQVDLYARAELDTEQVSVAIGQDGVVAVRMTRQDLGPRVVLTFAGMAEGRTPEEALAGLLDGASVSAPVAMARAA